MHSPVVMSDELTPSERLDILVNVVDQHESSNGGHTIFRVVDCGISVTVDALDLEPGDHPSLALLGLTPNDDWWAIGVQAHGRAHHLDGDMTVSDQDPSPMRMVYLLARTGEEAGILHMDGATHRKPGPSQGLISDLCRRVFGLPTDPPPAGPELLWTLMWLHRVLGRWNEPELRRDLLGSWSAVASLHPVFDDTDPSAPGSDRPDVISAGRTLAQRFTWSDLRQGARPVPLRWPACEMMPDDPRWFDDGSYARWVLNAFPTLNELAGDLNGLLGETHGDRLVYCARLLLE